ncbi:MAG: hypothetical protein C0511_11555, partial [Hyphomicrobium sp.]
MKLPLDIAYARQGFFRTMFVPGLFGSFERPLQSDLLLMKREGVAPASIHLGVRGIGFYEPVALMRYRTFDKVQDLGQTRF